MPLRLVKTTERASTISMDLRAIVQVHSLELSARQVGLLLFNYWLFKFFHLDIHECGSGPCQNNGTCVAGDGVYTCICTSGFTGGQCETSEIL